MNDDQLQREIEEALSVEPSPQFTARVRREIAAAPAPSRRLQWIPLTAGLVAVVLVAVLVLHGWTSRNLVTEKAPAPSARRPEVVTPEVEVPPVVSPSQTLPTPKVASKPSRPNSSEAPVSSRALSEVPEVLVDPREAEAFHSFVEAVEKQNIEPGPLRTVFEAADRTRKQEISPMPLAALEPIQIEPLSPAAPERGSL